MSPVASRKQLRKSKKAAKVASPVEEVVEPVVEQVEEEEDDIEEVLENDEDEEDEEEFSDDEEDVVVKEQRPLYNDEAALTRLANDLKLKDLPWIETMVVTSSEPTVVADVEDEMARELSFYQQALEAANIARDLVNQAGDAFTRPDDYFAEMLKSDEHMAKVRQRLLDETARLKASADAKRQRNLKKFGKKVQVEKQLERQKQKTDMLDKIKLLKRKRKDGAGGDLTLDNDFDIALENTTDKKRAKTDSSQKGSKKDAPQKGAKRAHKDTKYGMGGKKRHAKSNTAESSGALGGFNKMKGKPIYKAKGKTVGKAKR
ncbi:putative rRNA-processing protein ebp2 [Phycomyces blakesleeanus]|uniref:rRNA-processing protein ebp2 n=2 Tax=Phycomyces blakesleeanus TaxID=4837 RepID=A0ABR3AR69_PHYBL